MITRKSAVLFLKGLEHEGCNPFRIEKPVSPPPFYDIIGGESWLTIQDRDDSELYRLNGHLTSVVIDEKILHIDDIPDLSSSPCSVQFNGTTYYVFMMVYRLIGNDARYCAFLAKTPVPWGPVVLVEMDI